MAYFQLSRVQFADLLNVESKKSQEKILDVSSKPGVSWKVVRFVEVSSQIFANSMQNYKLLTTNHPFGGGGRGIPPGGMGYVRIIRTTVVLGRMQMKPYYSPLPPPRPASHARLKPFRLKIGLWQNSWTDHVKLTFATLPLTFCHSLSNWNWSNPFQSRFFLKPQKVSKPGVN